MGGNQAREVVALDTKYFQEALEQEFHDRKKTVGELTLHELSHILRRAQELKDADQRKSAVLDRMGA